MQQVKRISRRLKRVEIVLMVAAALVLMSGALALQTQDQLADKVVRLHVLANSDSEEDQALKLRVRDRVLGTGHGTAGAVGGTARRPRHCCAAICWSWRIWRRKRLRRRGMTIP